MRSLRTDRKNLLNEIFGDLKVIEDLGRSSEGRGGFWLCECVCGKKVEVKSQRLLTKHRPKRHCGCKTNLNKEVKKLQHRKQYFQKKYGRLTIIKEEKTVNKEIYWNCTCECGKTNVVVTTSSLNKGKKSCGCLTIEVNNFHLRSNSKEYRVWCHIKQRCLNPNHADWEIYGGRGIKVCDRWLNSFQSFFEDMGECPSGFSIERKDVNGNYEPDNCIWANSFQQARNKRSNKLNAEIVKDIRKRLKNIPNNFTTTSYMKHIAPDYGVSFSTIREVYLRKTWADID